jgi:hypothetical protein
MKEKILEILIDNLSTQKNICFDDIPPLCAKEITAMVMEFIKWLNFDLHDFYRILSQGVYADVNTDKRYDIDYIFSYWLTNIYKK